MTKSSSVPSTENPVFAGKSGDGGNRTHASVQPSDSDFTRATALALRDLAEQCDASYATLTLENGTQLVWDADDGFTLLPIDSDPLDISEWVDRVDFVPVEGVESVTEQPALRAHAAGAE